MIDGLTTGKQDIEEPKENEAELATIVEIGKNGLVLQFDGEEETREKNYRCNSGVKFAVGDRVKIHKTSGTYIVEYVVGNPNSRVPVGLPSGGSAGQVLTKTSSGAAWDDAPTGLPSGGSAGQVLTKTSSGAAWNSAPTPNKIGTSSYYVEVTTRGEVKMSNNKIGFFDSSPVVKQTLPTSATLGQLIKALKNYGLV